MLLVRRAQCQEADFSLARDMRALVTTSRDIFQWQRFATIKFLSSQQRRAHRWWELEWHHPREHRHGPFYRDRLLGLLYRLWGTPRPRSRLFLCRGIRDLYRHDRVSRHPQWSS